MSFLVVLLLLLCTGAACAEGGFPFSEETLHYVVNWPSGLSLGEGRMTATKAGDRWAFDLELQGAIPGFSVNDSYRSTASGEFCSIESDKQSLHGRRNTREHTAFDARKRSATRTTNGGGKTEISVTGCAKDALTFMFYTRSELGQGRVPPAQTILFGAPYQVRVTYAGAPTITVHDQKMVADRLVASLKGPSSALTLELFFARDAARTPLLIRVPFPLGTFSLELTP